MSVFKRALIKILRKKTQSMILFLIVFILSNILLTTFAVTMSLKDVKKTVLSQLPPIVSIGYNHDSLYSENEKNGVEIKLPKLDVEMANKLYENTRDMVSSFDYSTYASLQSSSLKFNIIDKKEDNIPEVYNQKRINLQGTQLQDTSLVTLKEATFIAGKGFSESDIKEGKPKAIVSKQFAQANQLEVGSIIELKNDIYNVKVEEIESVEDRKPIESVSIDVEVIGILEIESIEEYLINQESNQNGMTYFNVYTKATTFIVPNKFVEEINEYTNDKATQSLSDKEKNQYLSGLNTVSPSYILKNIDNLQEFEKAARKIYKGDNYQITSVVDNYEVIAKSLTSMEKLLDLIVIICIISSIAILSLVLNVFIFLRKKEMGIYLALGEKRYKIFSQLLLETIIISVVATLCATISAYFFSSMLANNTINSLLLPNDELIPMTETLNYNSLVNISPEMISNQYQGGFSIITILFFYLVMILTTIISQIATALYLLRLNPKKILM